MPKRLMASAAEPRMRLPHELWRASWTISTAIRAMLTVISSTLLQMGRPRWRRFLRKSAMGRWGPGKGDWISGVPMQGKYVRFQRTGKTALQP